MINLSAVMEFCGSHRMLCLIVIGAIGGLIATVVFRMCLWLHRERKREQEDELKRAHEYEWRQEQKQEREQKWEQNQHCLNEIERRRDELYQNFYSGDETWRKAIIKTLKVDGQIWDGVTNRIFNNPERNCSQGDYEIIEHCFAYATDLHDDYVCKQNEEKTRVRDREKFKNYYEQLRVRVEDLPLAMFCGDKAVELCELSSETTWYSLDDFDYVELDFGRFCRRLEKYEVNRKNLVAQFGYVYDYAYYAKARQMVMAELEEKERERADHKSKKRAKFERKCENANLPKWLRNQIIIDFR